MPPTANDILRLADTLSERDLDALPVGMIQLDTSGKILRYNQPEADLARLDRASQIGRSFFDQVAPCTKVKEFHGQFLEGVQRKRLFETFGFVFDLEHSRRQVAITLMYSERTDTIWVMISQAPVSGAAR